MSSQVSVSLNTEEIKKLIPALNSLMANIPGIKAEAGEYKNLLVTINNLLDQIYGPIPEVAKLLNRTTFYLKQKIAYSMSQPS